MIEIKHKETGKVLLELNVETLAGQKLDGRELSGADFSSMDLTGTSFHYAWLNDADWNSPDNAYEWAIRAMAGMVYGWVREGTPVAVRCADETVVASRPSAVSSAARSGSAPRGTAIA